MSHELKEGLELRRVSWPASPVDRNEYVLGENCSKITVSLQPGEMAMVPWVLVIGLDGEKLAIGNLSTCEVIEYRNGQ